MRTISILALAFALASCGRGQNDSGPQGVSANEARALDDAARMLETRRPPTDLLSPATGAAADRTGGGGATAR